jgi:hypothetical protein
MAPAVRASALLSLLLLHAAAARPLSTSGDPPPRARAPPPSVAAALAAPALSFSRSYGAQEEQFDYYVVPSNPSAPLGAVVFLLHGFNTPPQALSLLVSKLAARGHAVIAPTAQVLLPAPPPGLPRPGCASASDIASAGMLSTFDENLEAFEALPALAGATLSRIVLLGHSAGGVAATRALSGACAAPDPFAALLCTGFAAPRRAELAALVLFEGGSETAGLPPDLPLALLAGEFANATTGGAEGYAGAATGCKAFVKFGGMNHFGLADPFTSLEFGQVAPCARAAAAPGEAGFRPSAAEQEANVERVAAAVDAAARGLPQGGDPAARAELAALASAGPAGGVVEGAVQLEC